MVARIRPKKTIENKDVLLNIEYEEIIKTYNKIFSKNKREWCRGRCSFYK